MLYLKSFPSPYVKFLEMLTTLFGLLLMTGVTTRELERVERYKHSTWYLGMNLNPADGHVMDFTTGWSDDLFIGTYKEALQKDYLNREVWRLAVRYIALVRHQAGEVDAVKVFRFKEEGRSLLSRFQDMDPGRDIVTEGGPIQEDVSKHAQNLQDDPIFSVGGDLAFNWGYGGTGARVVLTGGHLSGVDRNDDNTHGLGNHFACNPLTGKALDPQSAVLWPHEISVIQNRGSPTKVQGTDHGTGAKYISGPVYGNYAIFVSGEASSFPPPGHMLDIEIDVLPRLKFFSTEL